MKGSQYHFLLEETKSKRSDSLRERSWGLEATGTYPATVKLCSRSTADSGFVQ